MNSFSNTKADDCVVKSETESDICAANTDIETQENLSVRTSVRDVNNIMSN